MYFRYPMKVMRITQSYLGNTSHKLHWYNATDYKDYPIDEAGNDTGRSPVYAPVDMRVVKIAGVGNSATNTIWLVTTKKVNTPKKNNTLVSMSITHWNDNDSAIKKLKVGSMVKKGDVICYEGTDGASANHVHLTFHYGTSNNWKKNSNGKWVTVGGESKYPENVCYVDTNFTTIKSSNTLKFQQVNIKRIASTTGLVLRESIGTSSKKILTIPYQEQVIVTNSSAGSKNGYNWSRVSYVRNGTTYNGYVASKYLDN